MYLTLTNQTAWNQRATSTAQRNTLELDLTTVSMESDVDREGLKEAVKAIVNTMDR